MKPVHFPAIGTRSPLRAPTAARARRRSALAAFVGVLVVGILGMHALATHGTTPGPTVTAATTAQTHATHASAMTDDSAGHDRAAPLVSSPPETTSNAPADPDPGSGHHMATMAMMCVVMLAAAALTLLVLVAVRLVRPLLPAAFRPAFVLPRTGQWVRGTGPPHEWAFSVIRC